MSSIPLPPVPQAGAAPTASAPQIASATLPSPPPALMAKYSPGQMLKVHVIDQLGANRLQVQTPQGPATLNTPLQAPPGTPLTLKLAMVNGTLTASVHGGPKAAMMIAGQQSQAQPAQTAQPGAGQVGRTALPQAGAQAPTTAPATGAAMAQAAANPAGQARAPMTTGAPQNPAQSAAAQTGGNAATAAAGRSAGSLPPVGTTVTAVLSRPSAGSALPQGTNLNLTLLSFNRPPTPGTPVGTILWQLPNGQSLMSTNQGNLTLNTRVPLPVGTQVGFSVGAPPAGATPTTTAAAQLTDLGETAKLTQRWQGLTDALGTLKGADPGAAQALLNNLPAPGPKMASALVQALNLFSGARPGALPALVGDRPLQALDRAGAKGTLDRLEKDFGKLKSLSSEPNPEGWRSYSVPVSHNGEIDQIRMAVKHMADDDEEDGEADGGSRFVLDLRMSSMGRVQLDGMVVEKKRRFDLILRTETSLIAEMRRDLMILFTEAQNIGGLEGTLSFQAAPDRFVPMPGIDDQRPGTAGLDV